MIENVKCPTCGGMMVSRKNRETGQRFWGCAKFPVCRGTLDTDGEAHRRREPDRDDDRPDYDEDAIPLPSSRWRSNDGRRWR